jgi:hypothetical protein
MLEKEKKGRYLKEKLDLHLQKEMSVVTTKSGQRLRNLTPKKVSLLLFLRGKTYCAHVISYASPTK